MATRTVGIDVAIRGLHVATILDEQGQPLGPPIRFRLSAAALDALVSKIRAGLQPEDAVVVVLEPTGMAWFPLARRLTQAGCSVIRVKGQRVKALRRYLSEYAKTDVTDAQVLGRMPAFGRRGLPPLYVPSAKQQALNRLTKQRARYQDAISSIRRRLLDLIRWAQPTLEPVLPPVGTSVSLALLEHYFNPARLQALGVRRLTEFIGRHVGGNHPTHGPFVEELVRGLLAAAADAAALFGPDGVDFELLQLEVRQEVQLLRHHRELLAELDRAIEQLYGELHPVETLRTVPGIGDTLGPALLGVLHTAARFGAQRRLRGFCGLFPRRQESGGVAHPGQPITQDGNNRIKRNVILAADVARTVDPELAAVYYRCMVEKGHHHRQALCAVATRLVNRIHAVLRDGRPYELRDLDGHAITVTAAKALIRAQLQVPELIRRTRRKTVVAAA
jgi:transposase